MVSKLTLKQMLLSAASLMNENSNWLSEIDSKFGDGDHGITIAKISALIKKKVGLWSDESICDFFDDLGMSTMEVKGGSAGPLYGTLFSGLGAKIPQEAEVLTCEDVKLMFSGALESMQEITNAKVGDKTMMDSLIPAVEAVIASEVSEPVELFKIAAQASIDGAKASEGFVSKFGRARIYKEQTIGTPDAGAASTSLFFKGIAKAI